MRISILFLCTISLLACREQVLKEGDYTYREGKVYYSGEKTNDVVFHQLTEPRGLNPVNRSHSSQSSILAFTSQPLTLIHPETGELSTVLAAKLPSISDDGLKLT